MPVDPVAPETEAVQVDPVEIGDADFLAGGAATSTGTAPAETQISGQDATGAAPVAAAAPADPNLAAGTQAQSSNYLLDVIKNRGIALPGHIGDDESALAHLLDAYVAPRQADIYAQIGQRLAPHAGQISQFLAQQQQPAKPERQPWEPPPFDQRWIGMVERDPGTGIFVGKPGTDPAITKAVNDRAEWQAKYEADPVGFMAPAIEQRAAAIADQRFDARLKEYQKQQAVEAITREVSPWYFQVGPDGQPARDYRGNPVVTPAGAQYARHVREIEAAGVSSPQQVHSLAYRLLQADIYAATQQSQAAAQGSQGSQAAVAQAARSSVNPLQALGGVARSQNPAATDPSQTGLSLMDRLRQDFAAANVTDADFAPVGA